MRKGWLHCSSEWPKINANTIIPNPGKCAIVEEMSLKNLGFETIHIFNHMVF